MSLPFAIAAAALLAQNHASDEARYQRVVELDVSAITGPFIYHRAGDRRSPAGAGMAVGGSLRVQRDKVGFALTYTGAPTNATTAGLGYGPAVHFIDLDASTIVAETGSRASRDTRSHFHVSGTFEAGLSLAWTERTLTNATAPDSLLDVPGHATVGANAGVLMRFHLPYFVVGAGLGYRGGVPLGVPEARYEGAGFAWLSIGSEVALFQRR